METLDVARERALICDSFSEARRAVKLRFEHATTDRLRSLVTLGTCGLAYPTQTMHVHTLFTPTTHVRSGPLHAAGLP
eukprot:scaffold12225_cov39-Isochrysis_galbana.AAC.1